ncbi:peptidase inhibitor family I36 protein [Streptomyces sp. NPDC046909]|uniref:peptidase inhibitor family I36 protein n=1 Tax=Streptomyces sp. NPDC046909 TaxID=3155617 RepID=UPI0033CA2B96
MKRAFGIVSAAVTLSAAAIVAAPPASASTADRNSCISALSVCVWQNTNYEGNRFAASGNWTGGCANSLTLGHSVANGRTFDVRYYSKDNCTGSYFDIGAHDYSSSTPFAVHSFRAVL